LCCLWAASTMSMRGMEGYEAATITAWRHTHTDSSSSRAAAGVEGQEHVEHTVSERR
jgi:hypothetical protein